MAAERTGVLIRTTLTPDEWRRVQALARARDLHASQLVAQTIRHHLLGKGKS